MQPVSWRISDPSLGAWQGARGVELRGYQTYYVKVEAGSAPCMALNGQPRTLATVCPRWAKWEKL